MDNEDEIYDAFDYANKFKFGVITGKKIVAAVKANDVSEVKRLINLPVDEGGLLLLRFTQTDEYGKIAIQTAEEMDNQEILSLLRKG
jgi:hypothetical protein